MSRDMVYEDVPLVSRRTGDNVTAGQNNSTIILGRDRVGSVESGYGSQAGPDGGKGAGAMHLVVGRKAPDPSVKDDAATLYLSAKTDPDLQGGTEGLGEAQKAHSGAILRADCVRITPRRDFKLSVGKAYMTLTADGKVVIEGDIQLGEGAAERILRGDAFQKFWVSAAHQHPTPSGLSGPPQPLPDSLLSSDKKVK